MKKKVIWCPRCLQRTVHRFINKETVADGFGFWRGIVAITTLGLSETALADKHWQCENCGKIITE